jgi:hypothetical protein
LAFAGFGLTPAVASPAGKSPAATHQGQLAPITDFSSRSRHRVYRNNAAALGTFLAIAGTVAAVAAANHHRHHHYYNGYYGGGPYSYYGGGPYYGRPYGYGRSYYGW